MNPREVTQSAPKASAGRSYTGSSVILKSLIASLVAVGAIALSLHFFSDGAFWPIHKSGDVVQQSDAESRAAQFAAMAPLPLALVPQSGEAAALEGMGLGPQEKSELLAGLHPPVPPAQPAQSAGPAQPAGPATPADSTKPADSVQPAADRSPAANPSSARTDRLAWVTLWDTDAEDGDVVRLDSQGYSRTVTLAKQPVTFAVPVPADGIIRVIGIRDGEGGGITVGLASGASKAVFPIMSVGQTLGLKVTFDR
jgi:hypothetical protein